MNDKKLVSIIIPVYNETLNIEHCHEELTKITKTLEDKFNFEILFCDNCSSDDSWLKIINLSQESDSVQGIRYSRNFGYQRSIYQGYLESRGDCAIQFDCDLQDPPELLVNFLEKWSEGFKIVYGKRDKREESFILQTTRKIFYRLANFLSEEELPIDVGEFRLIDRVVIEQLRVHQDHQPYLRGLIATYGFKSSTIPYSRRARVAGETKFNLKELFKIAFDGIFSYSVLPLRLSTYFGLFICFGSILYLIGIVLYKVLIDPNWPAGFATIVLLITLMIGLNALFMGIIGEYVARIFKQIKKSDVAIIEFRTSPKNI